MVSINDITEEMRNHEEPGGISYLNGAALVAAVISTLHEKYPGEEQHSTRVSKVCHDIGKTMGFSEEDTKKLELIGLLHDIGKIGIDESILNKSGKLNDAEWEEIKKHPDIGYRILRASSETGELASYVLAHHERFDGTGYPKGLKGEDIPLLSRILAVADAYDAMTSDRSYRAAMRQETVIAEIENNKAGQFDPVIADIFLKKVLPGYNVA